jgi:hypothetical protein
MYSPKRRMRLFRTFPPPTPPIPGPPVGTSTDILSFARTLATTYSGSDITPTSGGALTLNSQSAGNYEVTARKASTTISSFVPTDWFSSTKDTVSSWVVVNGNLTINSGQTFIPHVRKLFMVLYVTGNLTFRGAEISMTARGANHSGTGDSGGATTAVPLRIATGTYTSVVDYSPGTTTNPTIPAAGAAGGDGKAQEGAPNLGANGAAGQSGGGTAGVWNVAGPASGSGSAGTCFSGGAGGGAQRALTPASTSGGANGGAGGNGGGSGGGGGGAGNLGGTSTGGFSNGEAGTGGTLIIICEGIVDGASGGTLSTRGSAGTAAGGVAGGGSGGGSMTLLYGGLSALSSALTSGTTASTGSQGGTGSWCRYAIGAN